MVEKSPMHIDGLDDALAYTHGGEMDVVHVKGLQHLARIHDALPYSWVCGRRSWTYGDLGGAKALNALFVSGDAKSAAAAAKIAKRLDDEVKLYGKSVELLPAVAGGAVNAPAYLAGNPMCFRRPEWQPDATSVLRIFVPVAALAVVSVSKLRKRMLAQLALARAVSGARPVQLELYACEECSGAERPVLVRFPVGLSPIDWGMAGVMAQPGFFRDLCFRLLRWGSRYGHDDYVGGIWPMDPSRELLGASEDDLVLTRHDAGGIDSDPIGWVKEQVEKLNLAADEQQ